MAGLRHAFGADLFALYVYGAITFPETEGTVDLDYHAILERPPTPRQIADYQATCARLSDQPWGADLDGWVISRSQAGGSRPPAHLIAGSTDGSWALHRSHWLAGRCIVLYGPPPAEVVPAPDWAEVEADLLRELDFARRSSHDAYAVLNACRVLHSLRTGDAVRSKFGSAAWALHHLPAEHHAVIRAALATYRGHVTEADTRILARGRAPLFSLIDAELAD